MIKIWWMIIRSYRKRMLGMWLIFAVVILMITMVDQIVININHEIDVQTKPLVGADLIVESSQMLSWADALAIQQILSGHYEKLLSYVQFYSTVGNTDNPKLVQVQWVQSWYPLYGEIVVSMIADGTVVTNPRDFTGALVDEQTYELIGQSTGIQLWEERIPVVWIITSAPSAGVNVFDEGRKVIIPYEIVEQTKLTSMWSRVEYQWQVKLTNEWSAESLKKTIETQFDKHYQVRLARDRIEQLGWLS
jgi:predicted lysophospholipase L1 biosynthesis ABC-type transport system permease subunit